MKEIIELTDVSRALVKSMVKSGIINEFSTKTDNVKVLLNKEDLAALKTIKNYNKFLYSICCCLSSAYIPFISTLLSGLFNSFAILS